MASDTNIYTVKDDGGVEVRATLTYGAGPQHGPQRNLLLVNNAPRTAALQQGANRLTALVNQQLGGNISQDKSAVLEIRNNPSTYSELGVPIHQFGPVPGLLSGIYRTIIYKGQPVQAQLVFYYNRLGWPSLQNKDEVNNSRQPYIYPSQSAFLTSLRGYYSLLMKRYFEDVGAMYDEIRVSNLADSFQLSKQVEETIGASIQSKLRASWPSVQDWLNFIRKESGIPEEGTSRCKLFDLEHQAIFVGAYARIAALYLLNEFYAQMGVRPKQYLQQFSDLELDYDRYFEPGTAAGLFETIADLNILQRGLSLYQTNQTDELYNLHSNQSWVQSFLEFARFLLNLKRHPIAPEKGRIFLSFNYSLPSSRYFKQQVMDYYQTHFKHSVEVLTVEDVPDGDVFRDTIRARIWQADRLFVIVPKDTTPLGGGQPGSYQWLAREAEHGHQMNKKVRYFREFGFDEVLFEEVLGNGDLGFLAESDPRKSFEVDAAESLQQMAISVLQKAASERATTLLSVYRARTQLNFSIANTPEIACWKDLSSELQIALHNNGNNAIAWRHDSIIKGFLRSLPENSLLILYGLHKTLPFPKRETKAQIGKLINTHIGSALGFSASDLRAEFEKTWQNIKERRLVLKGEEYGTLELVSGKYYVFTLSKILRALQPEISEERLQNWQGQLLRQSLPERYQHKLPPDIKAI